MKKKLKKRIEEYCERSEFPYKVYYSEVIPDERYRKYKYFLKYHNTHKVKEAFKTQKEIELYLIAEEIGEILDKDLINIIKEI